MGQPTRALGGRRPSPDQAGAATPAAGWELARSPFREAGNRRFAAPVSQGCCRAPAWVGDCLETPASRLAVAPKSAPYLSYTLASPGRGPLPRDPVRRWTEGLTQWVRHQTALLGAH